MPEPQYYVDHIGNSFGALNYAVMDRSAPNRPAIMCHCATDGPAELIAKALNQLPETEREFRNSRLAHRRKANNSPNSETS